MAVPLMSDVELARFDTLVRVERGELAIADAVALLRLEARKATCPSPCSDCAQTPPPIKLPLRDGITLIRIEVFATP